MSIEDFIIKWGADLDKEHLCRDLIGVVNGEVYDLHAKIFHFRSSLSNIYLEEYDKLFNISNQRHGEIRTEDSNI